MEADGPAHRMRKARAADIPVMTALIHESVRGLSRGFYYRAADRERHPPCVRRRHDAGGRRHLLLRRGRTTTSSAAADGACGRRTMAATMRSTSRTRRSIPRPTRRASGRSSCTPAWARRGIGRMLLDACVAAARAAGFSRLMLVSTLPGEPLYRAYGFEAHRTGRGDAARRRHAAMHPDGPRDMSAGTVSDPARAARRRDVCARPGRPARRVPGAGVAHGA